MHLLAARYLTVCVDTELFGKSFLATITLLHQGEVNECNMKHVVYNYTYMYYLY